MTIKLTKTSIAALTLPPGKSDAIFFDSEVPGFGLRIRAGGSRKWIVQYQLHGHRQRRLTIGSIAVFDPKEFSELISSGRKRDLETLAKRLSEHHGRSPANMASRSGRSKSGSPQQTGRTK